MTMTHRLYTNRRACGSIWNDGGRILRIDEGAYDPPVELTPDALAALITHFTTHGGRVVEVLA